MHGCHDVARQRLGIGCARHTVRMKDDPPEVVVHPQCYIAGSAIFATSEASSPLPGETVPRRAIVVGSFSWIAKQMNLERLLEAANVVFTRQQIELHVVGLVSE